MDSEAFNNSFESEYSDILLSAESDANMDIEEVSTPMKAKYVNDIQLEYQKFNDRFDCLLNSLKKKRREIPIDEVCYLKDELFRIGEWTHLLKTSYLLGRLRGHKLDSIRKACSKKILGWKTKRKIVRTTSNTPRRADVIDLSIVSNNPSDYGIDLGSVNVFPERSVFITHFNCLLQYGMEHDHFCIPMNATWLLGDKTFELGRWANALRTCFIHEKMLLVPYQLTIVQEACNRQTLPWIIETIVSSAPGVVDNTSEDLFKILYKNNPESLIGFLICKNFADEMASVSSDKADESQGAWFHGKVTSKVGKYFRVVYEDGDEEDLSLAEVFQWRCKSPP